MRTLFRLVTGLIVLAILLAAWAWIARGKAEALAAVSVPDPASFAQDQVDLGAQLAALGDCVVCHTAKDGAAFAGGLGLDTPFGTVYSTNITPDPETGIGAWSLEAFVRAMRQGLDRQGNHLYPVFPYDQYAKVTDSDLAAIYAFLMTQKPVVTAATPNALRFPFNQRPLLAGWKLLYLPQGLFEPDPKLTEEQNRGAYLVLGLGHCQSCHSPRTWLGGIDSAHPFGGAMAEGWHVPAIGAASAAVAPWTAKAYENYLFDGWDADHGIAAGPMTAVIDVAYDASEDDVAAMAAYLATLAPEPDPAKVQEAVAAAAKLDWADGAQPGSANAPTEPAMLRGEAIFAATCTKCHKARVSAEQPASLGLSAVVNGASATNFLRVVREGIVPPRASRDRAMPAQAQKLSDQDLTDLAAFVRWRFTDQPVWTDIPQPAPAAPKTGG